MPSLGPAWTRAAAWLIALLSLSGCAAFRSYNAELGGTLGQVSNGNVDGAIKVLESNNKGANKDLLYYLEMGELQRLKDSYAASQKSWGSAQATVQVWEDTAKTDPSKLLGDAASYVVNDKLRPYEGHDYEKVMLTTGIALNFLALGELDNARVAIKQTHELEAVIADLRSQETYKVEQEARKRGATTSFKELNGYPVQSIYNPAVNALKNSYQSALSHYLAGFVYEALDEPSLAAAGYRQAIELQPNQPQLEQALAGLDQRVAAADDGLTDTLFVVGSGTAPARESRQFALPIPVNHTLVLVPVSLPVMQVTSAGLLPGQLEVDGVDRAPVTPVTNIDLMARRALQDEMPGIMLRGAIRSTAKAVTQYGLEHQAQRKDNGLLGLAGIAVAIGSVVTESADERTWRSLPAQIGIARTRLPPGTHTVTLHTSEGSHTFQFTVSGRYAVVGLRLMRGQLYVQAPVVSATIRATDAARVLPVPRPPATAKQQQPPQEISR